MEEYIVKVKSYVDDSMIECGTGIVVGNNLVITSGHILVGEKHYVVCHDKNIEAILIKDNEYECALLQTKECLPENTSRFTDDDILDFETDWKIQGFITENQINHEISGKGFHINEITTEHKKWNCILLNVISGIKNDYKGLSGSPVFANNRIVGILQRQEIIESGNAELKMITVSMFKELLPPNIIAENEYKIHLLKRITEHTVNEIEKNKTNRKYIPNIYVEEFNYKEMVRYFVDPYLFIKKSLEELIHYDLTYYNKKLLEQGFHILDFAKYKNILNSNDYTDDINDLVNDIKNFYDNIHHIEINSFEERSFVLFNNSLKHRISYHVDFLNMTSKKYLILTKEAGQGKTNFLCDFTENFLIKKDYYVLYFNASCFSDTLMNTLLQFITINNKYNINYAVKILNKEYKKTKKPFVIVIDGLNENNHLNDFPNQVKLFLERCEEYPFIKVLMTTRSEFFKEKFGKLQDGLYHNKYIAIHMKNFSKKDENFKARIFRGYLDFFNIHIIESSLNNITFNKLTNDLLFMRFFCEVNANKKNVCMYDIYVYDVFEHYTNSKCKKYSDGVTKDILSNLLNEIIFRMIKSNNYSSVSTENFAEDNIRLLNEMIDNEVIFKNETEIKKGFLSKSIETIGFTFDEYRDYCITNYLLENYDTEEKLLNFWHNMTDKKFIICEGVQKYLFYLSHTKYKKSLLGIISKIPEYENLYWNYIWNIEDKYIDDNDIQKCKNQIVENKAEMIIVIKNMLLRYDCRYYININIKTLISILDELLQESSNMFGLIVSLFPYKEVDDYRYDKRIIVCYFNVIIQKLSYNIKNNIDIETYEELIKFTVYIMENEQHETCRLWNLFYQHNKEKAFQILKQMNSHKNQVIQSNIADILSYLLRKQHDEKLQQLLDENNYSESTYMDWSELINLILDDMEE